MDILYFLGCSIALALFTRLRIPASVVGVAVVAAGVCSDHLVLITGGVLHISIAVVIGAGTGTATRNARACRPHVDV